MVYRKIKMIDREKLLKLFIKTESNEELLKGMNYINLPVRTTYTDLCLLVNDVGNLKSVNLLEINSIVDYLHDQLNIGHWSQVSIKHRQAFTACTFIKALIILFDEGNSSNGEEVLKCIDLGLLLGAPLTINCELLHKCASYINHELNDDDDDDYDDEFTTATKYNCSLEQRSRYQDVKAKEIPSVQIPSLEYFNREYFIRQIPVKLTGCMNPWPAMKKWPDVNYLLSVAGNRTVPIEIGSHYVDQNWTQTLMPLRDFIRKYFNSSSTTERGYLAQHNLFNQIKELRKDILIPEYCCLGMMNIGEPDINAWFGPQDTVSPLHYDAKYNMLAQVFGCKEVLLFAPDDSDNLYPYSDRLLNNTSQIMNPLDVDLAKYPLYQKSTLYKCLLMDGEMLFIPPKWWHHVTAYTQSFSVSFWWQ